MRALHGETSRMVSEIVSNKGALLTLEKSVAGWRAALNYFAILWPERMALAEGR